MEYIKPYTYFLKKQNGPTNLLWGSLALLSTSVIPFIGQVVVFGYQAEVAEDLKNDPELTDHRDFDPNKFVEYLTRGIWPTLVEYALSLAGGGLSIFGFLIGMGIGWLVDEPIVGLIIGLVFIIPVTLLAALVTWPFMLHTQLSKGLHFGNASRFAMAFFGKVGGQLFITMLIHSLISFPLIILGLILCFIGIFPVSMILIMAQEHYMIQLYRIYLDEGGEPIGGPQEQLDADW